MRLLRNALALLLAHLALGAAIFTLAPRAHAQPTPTPSNVTLNVNKDTAAITPSGNVTATRFTSANGLVTQTGNATLTGTGILSVANVTATDISNATTIAGWGDSLTEGQGFTPFGAVLAATQGATYYNGGVGGETSTQIKVRMLAATSRYGQMAIIEAGRNNLASPLTIYADIAAMVAALTTDHYLVLALPNDAAEVSGTAGYNSVIAINATLSSTYGARFADIRTWLVSQYNPGIPQDVTDHANDVPPSSLRADSLHWNQAGHNSVAAYLLTKIATLRGTFTNRLGPENITQIFSAPPGLGGTTPAPGAFTTLSTTGAAAIGGSVTATGAGSFGGLVTAYTATAAQLQFGSGGAGYHTIGRNSSTGALQFSTSNGSNLILSLSNSAGGTSTFTGPLAITGALSGVTTLTTSGLATIYTATNTQLQFGSGGAGYHTIGRNGSTGAMEFSTGNGANTIFSLSNSAGGLSTFTGPLALTGATGYFEGSEQASSPAAPAANGFRIYAKDNGAGKTVLYVRFATGAEQQIAIEP